MDGSSGPTGAREKGGGWGEPSDKLGAVAGNSTQAKGAALPLSKW